jgi:hypothetical protein
MDMEFNGYWTEGRILLDSYQRQARDSSMSGLLTFFKAYYAMTRGKVQSIKSREEEFSREEREQALNSAQAYFGLAYRYAARVEQPVLIIMCGLTGSGKSSLARALADSIGAEVLKSDEVRKDLAGVSRTDHHQVGFGQGLYSEEWTQKTYVALMQQGAELLKSGKPVILDASFLKRGQRSMARKTAIEHQVPFVCLQCECPREVARQRLAQRGNEDVSDGRWEIHTSQESAFEPFTEKEESELIRVFTDAPLNSCTQSAVQGLLDTIRVSVASGGQH